jgi:hypothetical protein
MNGSEIFTSRSRDWRGGNADRHVALELVLTVRNDAFTAAEAGSDDRQLVVRRPDFDRARLRQPVGVDDPHEETFRPALDGRRGDHNGVAARFEQHPRIDELTRPQLVVFIGKHRLQPDRGGGLVNDVVDQQQLSRRKHAPIVLVEGRDLDRPARHGIANVVEGPCRQSEHDRGRSREHQRRERPLVAGMDDIARIDEAHPDTSIVRGGDGGIFEIGLRRVDHRLVGSDRGFELVGLALLLVDDLLRRDVRLHQGLGAREVLARGDELRLVLCLFGLGVIERRLIEARIDQGQHVALLDLLALGEQDFLQLTVDLRMDADCQRALHGAESGRIDRHILPVDDRDAHRHLRARGKSGRLSSSGSLFPISISRAAGRKCAKADCDQDDATAA